MTTDPARGGMLLFGGVDPVVPLGDTWVGGAALPATTTAVGAGCLGTLGVPALVHAGAPWIGSPAYRLDVVRARWSSPAVFMLGLPGPPIPLGAGCSLHLAVGAPILTVQLFTNTSGFASLALAIPAVASIGGSSVAAQVVVFDPVGGALGLGLTLTRANVLTFGL
jgi:hypothetical protein